MQLFCHSLAKRWYCTCYMLLLDCFWFPHCRHFIHGFARVTSKKCPYWQPNPGPADRIGTSILHGVKSILCSTLCKLSTQVRAAHPQVDALTRWVVSDDWIDKYISKSVCYSPDWHAPTHTLQGEDSSAKPTARKTDNQQLVFSSNAPCAHLHSQTHRNTQADISAITCQSALPLSYKHRLFSKELRAACKV